MRFASGKTYTIGAISREREYCPCDLCHAVISMARHYIAQIHISAAMAEKIQSKHGVTPHEVREACQAPNRYTSAVWSDDPERGRRLIVCGDSAAGRRLKIVLFPVDVDEGIYRLGTALAATR